MHPCCFPSSNNGAPFIYRAEPQHWGWILRNTDFPLEQGLISTKYNPS